MRRIQFDPKKCTGCAACQMACNDQRDILSALNQTPLRHMEQREKDGKILDYTGTYDEYLDWKRARSAAE